jgi:predicted amidohydrolase
MPRAGLVQLNASDDPEANLPATERLVREAAGAGAELVLTPEVTNCVSSSRTRQQAVLRTEAEDATLARLGAVAAETGIWLLIGSLGLKPGPEEAADDGRLVNRSFLIAPDGAVAARYDKIHMFDVDIDAEESHRESAAYRPGGRAVLGATPWGPVGLTVCYDLRFPALYRALAKGGAWLLTVPAAFTVPTGRAHWEPLLRARAIETGCFVLAPAQWGRHAVSEGRPRDTWGHSLAIDPWGKLLADAGEGTGVTLVDLDPGAVDAARRRVPSLHNDRPFEGP